MSESTPAPAHLPGAVVFAKSTKKEKTITPEGDVVEMTVHEMPNGTVRRDVVSLIPEHVRQRMTWKPDGNVKPAARGNWTGA